MVIVLLILLALAIRFAILANTYDDYLFWGGLTSTQGNMARNLVEGKGIAVYSTGLVDPQATLPYPSAERRLIDVQDFIRESNETVPFYGRVPGYSFLLATTFVLFGEQKYIYLQVIQAL